MTCWVTSEKVSFIMFVTEVKKKKGISQGGGAKSSGLISWLGLIGPFKLGFHSVSVYLTNNHRDTGEGKTNRCGDQHIVTTQVSRLA